MNLISVAFLMEDDNDTLGRLNWTKICIIKSLKVYLHFQYGWKRQFPTVCPKRSHLNLSWHLLITSMQTFVRGRAKSPSSCSKMCRPLAYLFRSQFFLFNFVKLLSIDLRWSGCLWSSCRQGSGCVLSELMRTEFSLLKGIVINSVMLKGQF